MLLILAKIILFMVGAAATGFWVAWALRGLSERKRMDKLTSDWRSRLYDAESRAKEMEHADETEAARSAELSDQLAEATRTLRAHEDALESLRAELGASEAELERAQGAARALSGDNDTLRAEVAQKREDVAVTEAARAEAIEELARARDEIGSLQGRIHGLAPLPDEIREREARLSRLEEEAATLRAELLETRAELERRESLIRDRETALEEHRTALEEHRSELDQRHTELGRHRAETLRLSSENAELAPLRDRNAALEGRVAELAAEVERYRWERDAHVETLTGRIAELEPLVGELSAKNERLLDLERALDVEHTKSREQSQAIRDLESRVETAAGRERELSSHAESLARDHAAEVGRFDARLSELAPLEGRAAEQATRIAALEADINAANEAARAHKDEVRRYVAELAEAKQVLAAHAARIEELDSESRRITPLRDRAETEIARLETVVSGLQAELAERDARIAASEAQDKPAEEDEAQAQAVEKTNTQLAALRMALSGRDARIRDLERQLQISTRTKNGEIEALRQRISELEPKNVASAA